MDELSTDSSIGEQLPLIEPETGNDWPARCADDICVLLGPDGPTYDEGGGDGGGFDDGGGKGKGGRGDRRPRDRDRERREIGQMVAERWAGLGLDEDPVPKGRGKKGGKGDYHDQARGGKGEGKWDGKGAAKKSKKARGGKGEGKWDGKGGKWEGRAEGRAADAKEKWRGEAKEPRGGA